MSIIMARPRSATAASSATPPGLEPRPYESTRNHADPRPRRQRRDRRRRQDGVAPARRPPPLQAAHHGPPDDHGAHDLRQPARGARRARSEEHTSELQSLMRISYAVFCLKKKKKTPSP